MPMHAELLVGEHLHVRAHVVFHEYSAVAAPLVPVVRESVAILERSVRLVTMVHHETVPHSVQTVEEAELLTGAAQSIARRKQHRLRKWKSHSRIEITLQDAVITP
jgi:hypothetical protein